MKLCTVCGVVTSRPGSRCFVDRQVRDVLGRLFTPEPDPALVRMIRTKAPALSPGEIRASLGRLRTTFDFPVVAAPAMPPVSGPATVRTHTAARSSTKAKAPRTVGPRTPWRHVTLDQLISAGIVRVPFPIEHRYRGSIVSAVIQGASRIVFAGTAYDSLSTAGGYARVSVAGKFAGREIPQTNGWTFWEYRASDEALRPLDALRRELHEGKVVDLRRRTTAGA